MEQTSPPAKVASNDQLGPVAGAAYRCIAPACEPLGCSICNCAVPADVYAALGRAFQDVERERCAKLCIERAQLSWSAADYSYAAEVKMQHESVAAALEDLARELRA